MVLQAAASTKDTEMRVCTNSNLSDEEVVLEQIELYAQ